MIDQFELVVVRPVDTADRRQVDETGASLEQFEQSGQGIGRDIDPCTAFAALPDLDLFGLAEDDAQAFDRQVCVVHDFTSSLSLRPSRISSASSGFWCCFSSSGVLALGLVAEQTVVSGLGNHVGRCLPGLAEQALLVAEVVVVATVVVLPAVGLAGGDLVHQFAQAGDDGLRARHAAGDVQIDRHVVIELLRGGVRLPVHAAVDRARADADDVLGRAHLLVGQHHALERLDRDIAGDQQDVGLAR